MAEFDLSPISFSHHIFVKGPSSIVSKFLVLTFAVPSFRPTQNFGKNYE